MPTALATGYLQFNMLVIPGQVMPISNFVHHAIRNIVFDDGDGNADTATDYYFQDYLGYSGYTIEINGAHYALFGNPVVSSSMRLPYFDSFDNLLDLDGTAVIQPITQTGENAAVVNLCFAEGTMIATPDGETPVETLRIGDMITTADGRTVLVKWVGQQAMSSPVNVAIDEQRAPVCIKAGALESAPYAVPHTNLYVSADHGMIVDGLVINAAALVNGDTIRFVPASEMPSEFTYYHIETEAHDVILANGAASETFVDAAGRATFDNHQEYLDLYGVERVIPEMALLRVVSRRLVPQVIKDRLAPSARAASNVA